MNQNDFIARLLEVPTRSGTQNRRFHNEQAEALAMQIVREAYRTLNTIQWLVFTAWLKSHFHINKNTVNDWIRP